MLIGAPMARLPIVITMGNPRPAALYTASAMNRSPWLLVAVYVRTPAADAPIATDKAANSDSTLMNSQPPSSPDFTISPRPSTMCVCGVIGYAQMTCGRQSATASATACEPSVCLSIGCLPRLGCDVECFGSRRDVLLGNGRGKLLADCGDDRWQLDHAGDRCEAAQKRGVRNRAPDVLHRQLARRQRAHSILLNPARKAAEAELVGRLHRVEQDVAANRQPAEEIDLVQQRLILDDQRVGRQHRLAQ